MCDLVLHKCAFLFFPSVEPDPQNGMFYHFNHFTFCCDSRNELMFCYFSMYSADTHLVAMTNLDPDQRLKRYERMVKLVIQVLCLLVPLFLYSSLNFQNSSKWRTETPRSLGALTLQVIVPFTVLLYSAVERSRITWSEFLKTILPSCNSNYCAQVVVKDTRPILYD